LSEKTFRIINESKLSIANKRDFKIMTPSLANFLWSLFWGGLIVVIPVVVGLVFISQTDKIERS
jgi:photosystem II PsbX protein